VSQIRDKLLMMPLSIDFEQNFITTSLGSAT
jgi:hypothetical protein